MEMDFSDRHTMRLALSVGNDAVHIQDIFSYVLRHFEMRSYDVLNACDAAVRVHMCIAFMGM